MIRDELTDPLLEAGFLSVNRAAELAGTDPFGAMRAAFAADPRDRLPLRVYGGRLLVPAAPFSAWLSVQTSRHTPTGPLVALERSQPVSRPVSDSGEGR